MAVRFVWLDWTWRSNQGRKSPTRVRVGNDRLQYLLAIQQLTLNDRFVVYTGHPSNSLRYL